MFFFLPIFLPIYRDKEEYVPREYPKDYFTPENIQKRRADSAEDKLSFIYAMALCALAVFILFNVFRFFNDYSRNDEHLKLIQSLAVLHPEVQSLINENEWVDEYNDLVFDRIDYQYTIKPVTEPLVAEYSRRFGTQNIDELLPHITPLYTHENFNSYTFSTHYDAGLHDLVNQAMTSDNMISKAEYDMLNNAEKHAPLYKEEPLQQYRLFKAHPTFAHFQSILEKENRQVQVHDEQYINGLAEQAILQDYKRFENDISYYYASLFWRETEPENVVKFTRRHQIRPYASVTALYQKFMINDHLSYGELDILRAKQNVLEKKAWGTEAAGKYTQAALKYAQKQDFILPRAFTDAVKQQGFVSNDQEKTLELLFLTKVPDFENEEGEPFSDIFEQAGDWEKNSVKNLFANCQRCQEIYNNRPLNIFSNNTYRQMRREYFKAKQ
jgi:hypothetical protein